MSNQLHFTFLLPGAATIPSGGFKVVYEYANGLVNRGHSVTLVHAALVSQHPSVGEAAKKTARYVQRKLFNSFGPTKWFTIDPRVKMRWVHTPTQATIPEADVIVATAWQTAPWVAEYPAAKGKKLYLIQSLETWDGPEEEVLSTWRMPLHKVVIARWLGDFAALIGEKSTYIPNGLDFVRFNLDTEPELRNPGSVMMLYHTNEVKGSTDGLKALYLAKEQYPALSATLFGAYPQPPGLPSWIEYHYKPEQDLLRKLYNSAAVFVSPSRLEGWPLPPAEALLCGASLVATDIGGHREYAEHGETALLTPPRDPISLASALISILRDSDRRICLARKGNEMIQKFTWSRALDSFEQTINAL